MSSFDSNHWSKPFLFGLCFVLHPSTMGFTNRTESMVLPCCFTSCDDNGFVCFFLIFQCCPATHAAPLVSFQTGSVTARGTTSGTRSDTAVSPALCWKVTVSSPVLYHLAVEHSGTSPHRFVEVRGFPRNSPSCWGHEKKALR